jgi:hypothetical protein
MKRKAADIALTASRFSSLVGVDRNEILNRLEEAKAEPVGRKNGGNEYTLRDLFHAAIGGDIQEQRLRKLRAEADHLELSLRTKHRELVPVSESVETVVQCAWDIRAHILSMPIPHADQDALIMGLQKVSDIWQARIDAEKLATEDSATD